MKSIKMNMLNRCRFLLACYMASFLFLPLLSLAEQKSKVVHKDINSDDLHKGIAMLNTSLSYYFTSDFSAMHRFYNPFTKLKSQEKASVWMYTSAIESVNLILKSLQHQSKKQDSTIINYEDLLKKLYDNADFYLGTFELTSFTQTQNWSVYAVDRVNEKGKAKVTGVYNVYDDQMWLIRELLESFQLTKNKRYLDKAEYLTQYVLDGWDATRDANGEENGGILWGPGYVTKHACSNGPMISPLVWLAQIYSSSKEKITHNYIDAKDKKTRKSKRVLKKEYYLNFAKKIYDWQKKHLLNSNGVYADMMGDCYPNCNIIYEEVAGVKYRAHTALLKPTGRAFTYNSGTMISGAADLYKKTKNKKYLIEAKQLAKASFAHFALQGKQVSGYYSFPYDGFSNWFNTVLLRGYIDLVSIDTSVGPYIEEFRKTLNYAYTNYNKEGLIPANLLGGWNNNSSKNNIEGMFMFSFASQWALFDQYLVQKK